MKVNKGKHYFWSQLLFSMIAIFALPGVQQLRHPEQDNPTYQNQSVQQQITGVVRALQQEQLPQIRVPLQSEEQKRIEFRPHFYAADFTVHAPIRGSPRV